MVFKKFPFEAETNVYRRWISSFSVIKQTAVKRARRGRRTETTEIQQRRVRNERCSSEFYGVHETKHVRRLKVRLKISFHSQEWVYVVLRWMAHFKTKARGRDAIFHRYNTYLFNTLFGRTTASVRKLFCLPNRRRKERAPTDAKRLFAKATGRVFIARKCFRFCFARAPSERVVETRVARDVFDFPSTTY